jgi:putative addiction module killer protein
MRNRYILKEFVDRKGRRHFAEWFDALDQLVRRRIAARLTSLENGNIGDNRYLGAGIGELRFSFGPGYRIYFGRDGSNLIVLLCGGDKARQDRDIQRARSLWSQYRRRQVNGTST